MCPLRRLQGKYGPRSLLMVAKIFLPDIHARYTPFKMIFDLYDKLCKDLGVQRKVKSSAITIQPLPSIYYQLSTQIPLLLK